MFASHRVSWSCAPSGCLAGLRPDILLQWEVLNSPSPWLHLLQLSNCVWNTCQWRLMQRSHWLPLPSPYPGKPDFPFSSGGLRFSIVFLLSQIQLQKLFLLLMMSLVRLNSYRASAFLTWSLTVSTISPSSYSTLCRPPFCVWVCPGTPCSAMQGLLAFLPDFFFFVGMYHSWAWRR